MLKSPREALPRRPLSRAFGASLAALLAALSLLPAACRSDGSKSDPSAQASASGAGSAARAPSPGDDGATKRPKDEDVRPVYPVTKDPPDPLADKLCAALYTLPATRKAECCGDPGPGATFQGECTRVLSFALREKSVTLDPAAVDRCSAAIGKAHEACDWVGPLYPLMADECRGILQGTLAAGARCRSSLECAGNLHCEGVGPTTFGACAPPRPATYGCAAGVDTLASYVRQDTVDEQHPECTGLCEGHRCMDLLAVGAECRSNAVCGPSNHCEAGRCAAGLLPAAGQPCAKNQCGGQARCMKGTCTDPKKEGEACETDNECRSACVRPDGGSTGTCGKRCKNLLGF